MEYRQLGKAGVKVSAIGLGTNSLGVEATPQPLVNQIIDTAIELGINLIDTADIYTGGRSEEVLGVALKGKWNKVVLSTKFASPTGSAPNDRGSSRYHLMHAVEDSLRRLQSDHIDIYYVHRWDKSTPEEETLRALDDLVRSGKVRYLGVSALPAWQVAHANAVAELKSWTDFVVVQSHYHLLERGVEAEVLPYCNAYKVGFIPFFPMAGGFLTGKYKRGEPAPAGSRGENSEYVKKYMTDANYTRVEKLSAWAAEHNHAMNELAQAWLLAQPGVCSVISGATKVDQILSNVNAFEWKLTASELDEIRAILTA